MVSLGSLNANYAATSAQTNFVNESENEQFLEFVSTETEVNAEDKSTDGTYYFNPETVLPVAKKSLEQEIAEDNLVVENTLTTVISLDTPIEKSIALTIYEDVQITQASNLDTYQPLDFDVINNTTKSSIDVQNKCSLKVENIKL